MEYNNTEKKRKIEACDGTGCMLVSENGMYTVVDRNGNIICKFDNLQPVANDMVAATIDRIVKQLEGEIELVVTEYPLQGKYIKKSRAINIVQDGIVSIESKNPAQE